MTFDIIYAKDLWESQEKTDTQVIDIRSAEEFAQEHWAGAENMPLHETDSYEAVLPENRYYILYCQHGGSSMQLARYLGRRGYRVGTVVGGFETMKKIRKNYLKKQDYMTK